MPSNSRERESDSLELALDILERLDGIQFVGGGPAVQLLLTKDMCELVKLALMTRQEWLKELIRTAPVPSFHARDVAEGAVLGRLIEYLTREQREQGVV